MALAEIAWDPEIRNILALAFGVIVLCGSVQLIVSTNTGPRTGFLVALAGLSGWMVVMGLMWWMYGIGMKGEQSHWRVIEINKGDLTQAANDQARRLPDLDEQKLVKEILAKYPDLEKKVNPEGRPDKVTSVGELVEADTSGAVLGEFHLTADDLGGWHILVPSNKQRGDAQAAADAALAGTEPGKPFQSTSDYKVLEAFDFGGKNNVYKLPDDNACDVRIIDPDVGGCIHRIGNKLTKLIHVTHPKHFAIVQVQPVVEVEVEPGGTPPTPKADPNEPVYSVIMIRSLGDLRFPAFAVTVGSGALFALCCWMLHRRDKVIAANRAAAAT